MCCEVPLSLWHVPPCMLDRHASLHALLIHPQQPSASLQITLHAHSTYTLVLPLVWGSRYTISHHIDVMRWVPCRWGTWLRVRVSR